MQQNPVDLIFLDIHMPELQGIQFLKLLQGKSKVVLTTAYPEYALEGYEHDVLDYLLKPVMFERFLKAVQKMMNHEQVDKRMNVPGKLEQVAQSDHIFVKTETRGKITRININDILYIEALGNYIGIHKEKGKILTLVTMKDIEAQIPSNQFVRIHKSYIVNITKINAIDGSQLFINKSPLPVGNKYKEHVLSVIESKIVKGSGGRLSLYRTHPAIMVDLRNRLGHLNGHTGLQGTPTRERILKFNR